MKPIELNRKNEKNMSKWETRKCIECDVEFDVYKKSKKKYCSKKCSNTSQILIDIKNKSAKQTIDEKYNGIHYMNNKETQQKHKQSMLKNHGVEHALQSDICKRKQINTLFDRYGITNPMGLSEFRDKIKQTKLEKYGDETYHNIEKLNDNTYNKFLDWNHITPLFDRNEFSGVDTKKYKFKCNKCDRAWEASTDNGYVPSCRNCNKNIISISKGETEVYEFIKSIYSGKIITGDRDVLNGKELDIYLPELNIAIEYNGLYWHSELRGNKNKYYHLNKTEECNKLNIKLIHIFEHEWVCKQNIIKSMILTSIGNNTKLYARKCTVKNITTDIKNEFLSKYHIQSGGRSNVKLGLFYDDILVSVMTFGKSRFDGNYTWEIIRLATKSNFIVVGGASKLLKYFIKNYNPTAIVTYSDRRFGEGNVYNKIGFDFVDKTPPSYYYIKGSEVYSRFQYQKHKLKFKLNEYDENISEWENMVRNGYDRIWDCGHNKFEMIL